MAPFGARDQISAVLAFMNEWELCGNNTTERVVCNDSIFVEKIAKLGSVHFSLIVAAVLLLIYRASDTKR